MAPWPEQGNEPKAPDNTSAKCCDRKSVDVVKSVKSVTGQAEVNSTVILPEEENIPDAEEEDVLTLNERELKNLLDEAITYKNPKDREGKSKLFKNLLQKAESDDTECGGTSKGGRSSVSGSGTVKTCASGRKQQRKQHGHSRAFSGRDETQTRGGSLQNIVHEVSAETFGRKYKGSHGQRDVTVSARLREGGSLPSDVNNQGVESLEVGERCRRLQPHAAPTTNKEMELIQHSEVVCNYTSRATLELAPEIIKASHEEDQVDVPIVFPIATNKGLTGVSERLPLTYSTAKCITSTVAEVATSPGESNGVCRPALPTPVQHVSMLSIPAQQIVLGSDSMNRVSVTKECMDGKAKPCDENGNSLAAYRVDNIDRKGKPRRLKTRNERYCVLAENIEGHRGNVEDVNVLVKYINNETTVGAREQGRGKSSRQNNVPVTIGTKRSVGGKTSVVREKNIDEDGRKCRRNKEGTHLHKCNSLEEVSKTKLEDLTSNASEAEESNESGLPLKQKFYDREIVGREKEWQSQERLQCASSAYEIGSSRKFRVTEVDSGSEDCLEPFRHFSSSEISFARPQALGYRDISLHTIPHNEIKSMIEEKCANDMTADVRSVTYLKGLDADVLRGRQKTVIAENSSPLVIQFKCEEKSHASIEKATDVAISPTSNKEGIVEDSEFHIVTKKQRRKKRQIGRSGVIEHKESEFPPHDGKPRGAPGEGLYRYTSIKRSPPRRKSASSVPPSDKSADSSDLDSVHSLPVSSTTSKQIDKQLPSHGSTLLASYAQIARSVVSPPRYNSDTVVSGETNLHVPASSPELVPTVTLMLGVGAGKKDAMTNTSYMHFASEEYPPLVPKHKQSIELFVEYTLKRGSSNQEESNVAVEETVVLKKSVNKCEKTNYLSESATILVRNPQMPPTSMNRKQTVSDSIVNGRPPVILVGTSTKSTPATELTFGFEVNQQLLDSDIKSSTAQSITSHQKLVNYIARGWEQTQIDIKAGVAHEYNPNKEH